MKRILLLACCVFASDAEAATLKTFTTLQDGVVRLSDLFDGADSRPIGPAPGPGGRITVESRQLGAIAKMFGVDWMPNSPADRAVLERAGRSLTKADVIGPLRVALQAMGAPRDGEIDLPGFTSALLPAGALPELEFTGLTFDAGSGRFSTLLVATPEGAPAVQVRLAGRVQEMVELPVPIRAMAPGEIVGPKDLQWTRMRAGLGRGELVRYPAQAEGQALRRAVQPGQPLQVADLGRPIAVLKNAPLMLSLESPGLSLTAQGVAAEAGGVGDVVKVRNPFSRVVVDAEVTGPGRARVLARPGAPAQLAAR